MRRRAGSGASVVPGEEIVFDVTYDPVLWIPCPQRLPQGTSRRSWAARAARDYVDRRRQGREPAKATSPRWDERQRKAISWMLSRRLAAVYRAYEKETCSRVWAFGGDPAVGWVPVFIWILDQEGGREDRLRELASGDYPLARAKRTGDPRITEIEAGSLGAGVHAMRTWQDRDGTVYTFLGYAFRPEGLKADILLAVSLKGTRVAESSLRALERFVQGAKVG